jgi:hypothetical protein
LLGVDEFDLEIVDLGIIQVELALERLIGDPPAFRRDGVRERARHGHERRD